MKIVYGLHLLRRLKQRKIPKHYPKKILENPEKEYFDSTTLHNISVKKLPYGEKIKHMVIAYDIIADTREIITVYPISESELSNKVKAGRWKSYEKN